MKHRILVLAIPLLALASCGADRRAGNAIEDGPMANTTLAKLSLTSDAFQEGQAIPVQYSCDGADQPPALSWSDPPEGTKSFALIVDDPDAPRGLFRHWGAWDIPASTRSIAAGQKIGTEATNDFGKAGYGGPCPPKGHGVHHYHFKLYALDVDTLGLDAGAKVADAERAVQQHAIGQAELIGTFERK